MEYEAFIPLALKTLKEIADQLLQQFEIQKIAFVHRVGVVPVGEASLAVFISGNHRKDPMDAVKEAVYLIKAKVPIWKHEFYHDGSEWKGNVECKWSCC